MAWTKGLLIHKAGQVLVSSTIEINKRDAADCVMDEQHRTAFEAARQLPLRVISEVMSQVSQSLLGEEPFEALQARMASLLSGTGNAP